MNQNKLIETVARLMTPPKGILAMDESLSTCNKRFEKLGVPTTEEKRREYRELLITAPNIEKYISGYILFGSALLPAEDLRIGNYGDVRKELPTEFGGNTLSDWRPIIGFSCP